ncbi:hypothetical protein [Paenibacillus sp. NPDC057934]|uniref:hypothetical protein n=1 Tax=Paenibacillus sp. NPDC057934 TaxID=3346282 RepID=UPI0036DF0098
MTITNALHACGFGGLNSIARIFDDPYNGHGRWTADGRHAGNINPARVRKAYS